LYAVEFFEVACEDVFDGVEVLSSAADDDSFGFVVWALDDEFVVFVFDVYAYWFEKVFEECVGCVVVFDDFDFLVDFVLDVFYVPRVFSDGLVDVAFFDDEAEPVLVFEAVSYFGVGDLFEECDVL
jgi:hypothetical protein